MVCGGFLIILFFRFGSGRRCGCNGLRSGDEVLLVA